MVCYFALCIMMSRLSSISISACAVFKLFCLTLCVDSDLDFKLPISSRLIPSRPLSVKFGLVCFPYLCVAFFFALGFLL